jgi:hypothetical protein
VKAVRRLEFGCRFSLSWTEKYFKRGVSLVFKWNCDELDLVEERLRSVVSEGGLRSRPLDKVS